MAKRRSHRILNGRATAYPPTENRGWQVSFSDPVTLKRRVIRGGKTLEEATERTRKALGDYVAGADPVPTCTEVFLSWIAENQSRWSDRTVQAYRYRWGLRKDPKTGENTAEAAGPAALIGSTPVTAVNPRSLTKLADGLSREQAKRVRTIVRAVFERAYTWTHRDAQLYAGAILLPGGRDDDRTRRVQPYAIPSTTWVVNSINCFYSTMQLHPVLQMPGEFVDPVTGYHGIENVTIPKHQSTTLGAPKELIDGMRRGMPKHYADPSGRRSNETRELAKRMRMIGLMTALGAAGALRIGEVLALRVRHFLPPGDPESSADGLTANIQPITENPNGNTILMGNYRGRLEVVEAVTPTSRGVMTISRPKGGKTRTVWLPALMYPIGDERADLRALASRHVDVGDRSLWALSVREYSTLWRRGMIPLTALLQQRLQEIYDEVLGKEDAWRNSLLFPTRSPARKQAVFPEKWPHTKEIPGGYGYQSSSNLVHRYVSPVYDHVSDLTGSWPSTNEGRRGWTHHSLRHYAISQWVARGVPIPVITAQAGHSRESFTLERYAAAIMTNVNVDGFEG